MPRAEKWKHRACCWSSRWPISASSCSSTRTSPDSTAFVHRDGLFQLKHSAVAEPPVTAGAQNAAHRWVTRCWATTHSCGSGLVLPNFADPDLDSPAGRYYGSNLARLRLIKQHYDPGGMFRHSQSIPLPDPPGPPA